MQHQQGHTTRPMITAAALRTITRTSSMQEDIQQKLLLAYNSRVDDVFKEVKATMMADGFEASLKTEARESNETRYLLKTLSSEGCGCPPCFCGCVISDNGIQDVLNDVVHKLKADPETSKKIPAGATFRSTLHTDPCDASHVFGHLYVDWSPACSLNVLCSRKMI